MRPDERIAATLGALVHELRAERGWTLTELAERARLSRSFVQAIEVGHVGSLETYDRVARALGRRLDVRLLDPRRSTRRRDEDPVHAAMGELFAADLAAHGFPVSLDEPYQHYQFAGRGDVVAWDLSRRALLHIENRTALPNLQEAAGSYNAKRRWLAESVADRLGLPGFRSVTHAFVGLWSAELIHAIRVRHASIAALCPDPGEPLVQWLSGNPPVGGMASTFVLIDPIRRGRADRRWLIDLSTAVNPGTRPRYRGYADAAEALRRAGLA